MPELDEPVQLSPYDPQWPAVFAAESRRLRETLPPDIPIEHIGSTAVPGLLAKPIIDIMIGTERQAELPKLREELAMLGDEDLGEAGVPGRLYFRRRVGAAFNIALVEHEGALWTANLAFRDYLRQNPEVAREYEAGKRTSIEQGIGTLLAYSDRKAVLVVRIMNQALNSRGGKSRECS